VLPDRALHLPNLTISVRTREPGDKCNMPNAGWPLTHQYSQTPGTIFRRAPGQRTARGLRGTITQAADDGRERRHRADRDPEKEHCSCRPRDIKVKGRSLRSVGGPLGLA